MNRNKIILSNKCTRALDQAGFKTMGCNHDFSEISVVCPNGDFLDFSDYIEAANVLLSTKQSPLPSNIKKIEIAQNSIFTDKWVWKIGRKTVAKIFKQTVSKKFKVETQSGCVFEKSFGDALFYIIGFLEWEEEMRQEYLSEI